MRPLLLLVPVLLCTSFAAQAWDTENFKEEIKSPLSDTSKYVLIGGAAATATLTVFRSQLVKPFQRTQVRNAPLGAASHYGDLLGQWIPNLAYISAMALSGTELGSSRSLGMLKATSYAVVATTLLKYSIREPRPDNPAERNAFPSGHTTTAFAFSGYVAAEHGWKWGVPATVMSSFVGYSRINDNRHWLNDVVAGATIGWAFGWGISKLGQSKRKPNNPNPIPTKDEKKQEPELPTPPVFVPLASSDSVGIGVIKEF